MRPAYVYSKSYDFRLPELPGTERSNMHRFDGLRAQRAWELFLAGGELQRDQLLQPREVSRAELERVHAADYLDSLSSPAVLAEILEIPGAEAAPIELLEQRVLAPMRLAAGGTLLATEHALRTGLVLNLAGGYHHAKPARGEGFCVYNDLAVALRWALDVAGLERVMVVDLDAHQGNGVSLAFADEPRAAILDCYNRDIFPGDEAARRGLRWDLPLSTGTSGVEYLDLLLEVLPAALDEFRPQLLLYNAGTDVVAGDPLGLLEVSPAHVVARDLLVIEQAAGRDLPLVVTPSGGYTEESHRLIAATLSEVRSRWGA
jgi:histone deacetylase 11